jgi:DNA-binding GntR family transcriptional regulator
MPLSEKPARQITRPVPLRQSVYEAILDMIIERTLRPGQHLVENELAVMLGVSRQPVREALQWLKNDGWVDLRPGHGAFVHAPTVAEADQLLAVRALLETESARLAALHATDVEIKHLRELCEQGVAALKADEMANMVALNADLHTAVAQYSGNRVLVELAAQVDRRVRWYYTPIARSRGELSWEEHIALIDAIEARDADRAAQIMREHTEHTRRAYLERTAAHEDEAELAHDEVEPRQGAR